MKLGQLRELIESLYIGLNLENTKDAEELNRLDNSDVRVMEISERGSNWEYQIDYRRSEWYEKNEVGDSDFAGILYLCSKNQDYLPREVQEYFGFIWKD